MTKIDLRVESRVSGSRSPLTKHALALGTRSHFETRVHLITIFPRKKSRENRDYKTVSLRTIWLELSGKF